MVYSFAAACSHAKTSFDRHALREICGTEKTRVLSFVVGSFAYFNEFIVKIYKKINGTGYSYLNARNYGILVFIIFQILRTEYKLSC